MPASKPSEVQHLLTIEQTARRLNISTRTLWRLIAARKFPQPVRVNTAPRVLFSDLEAYIDKLATDRSAA